MNYSKELDRYFTDMWNNNNPKNQINEELLWDLCRELESQGIAVGDDAAVSAKSIGPFRIATTLEFDQMEIVEFFLDSIIPSLFYVHAGLPFDQFYALYLLPAIKLVIKFITNTVMVNNYVDWEVLLYIKNENQQGNYPTKDDIFNNISNYTHQEINESVERLKSEKTISKNNIVLVCEHLDKGLESKV